MSKNWKNVPSWKPMPLLRPRSSTTRTIFQMRASPARADGHEIGVELREVHAREAPARRHPEHGGDVEQAAVDRPGAFSDRHHDGGNLVERHRRHRRHLGEAEPDVAEDGGHEGREC